MSRRALRFGSQEGAPSSQKQGSNGERTPQITNFFKPVSKPDGGLLTSAIGNDSLRLQSHNVAEKSPSPKRRRKIPLQSPSKSPIMEAFLRRMKDDPSTVTGISASNGIPSKVDSSLDNGNFFTFSRHEDSSPSASELESCKKKPRKRSRRDSVDSDESFQGFSLSSDDDETEETLKPLDEIIQMVDHSVPATPQKGDCSALSLSQTSLPDTPVNDRLEFLQKTPHYDNDLERLVKEQKESERIDAIFKQLHEDIEKGQGVADEEAMESEDNELPDEYKDFLKKFTVETTAIPDQHPGEEIFHLSKSGAIFSPSTLNLQNVQFSPGSPEEEIIFRCSPENQLELATEGMLTTLYSFRKCPELLMKWMFQMASVHPCYTTSVKLLNTLVELTCNNLANLEENPWTPSLLDIATVFFNMGIPFETLFPLANILPSFTALDLVSAVPGSGSTEQIFSHVPEFHIAHVIKFVSLCTAVYRETFKDMEILALLVMLLKMYLEKELKNVPVMEFHCLIANLLQNIRKWQTELLPELCFAVSQLSSHHHNFIKLLHLIPTFDSRGREVRRHVSLIFMSNILFGSCTYFPLDYASQMLMLCSCMCQMKPSSLAKKIQRITENEPKTPLNVDQEAYYLTYSLLHFLSDASSSDEPPATQRKYLQKLCTELEKHIKSDIREDARFFYRTKVKDLISRIHGRWQELLLCSRPDQGKLHDYWQPVCDGSSPQSSQERIDQVSSLENNEFDDQDQTSQHSQSD
ncbi:SMC5-SMC6 complex localization factor protein 2 [Gastrophryne carolinensis]